MKITTPQRRELRLMEREPQRTFGASRVKVQNNLVQLGLARYIAVGIGELCEITPLGRAKLRECLTAK